MNLKKVLGVTVSAFALGLIMLSDANAAGISVKCEARNGRSKASVDGSGVLGRYYAVLKSGANKAQSRALTADPVTREVEFDFDSNPRDIAAGATPIKGDFIRGGRVVGSIYRVQGNALVGSASATCRTR